MWLRRRLRGLVGHTHFVRELEVLLAGQLVVGLGHVVHHLATALLREAVPRQQLANVLPVPVTKWAAWREPTQARPTADTASGPYQDTPTHTQVLLVAQPHTVVVSLAGRVGEDDLHATVGRVVGPLPLLPVTMANVVGILLVKLRERKEEEEEEGEEEGGGGGGGRGEGGRM